MKWPIFSYQVVVIVIAVFLGINFFALDTASVSGPLQKAISTHMLGLDDRLKRIERAVSIQEKDATGLNEQSRGIEKLDEIYTTLHMIVERLDRQEQNFQSLEVALSRFPLNPTLKPNEPLGAGPLLSEKNPPAWTQELPEEKQFEIDNIMMQHRAELKETFSSSFEENGPPPPERLRELMEQHELALEEKLQEILSDQEYENFLNSRPKMLRR